MSLCEQPDGSCNGRENLMEMLPTSAPFFLLFSPCLLPTRIVLLNYLCRQRLMTIIHVVNE